MVRYMAWVHPANHEPRVMLALGFRVVARHTCLLGGSGFRI